MVEDKAAHVRVGEGHLEEGVVRSVGVVAQRDSLQPRTRCDRAAGTSARELVPSCAPGTTLLLRGPRGGTAQCSRYSATREGKGEGKGGGDGEEGRRKRRKRKRKRKTEKRKRKKRGAGSARDEAAVVDVGAA